MRRVQVVELQRVVSRVDELRSAMPAGGMTLAAFEALALREVSPRNVFPIVKSLHNRRSIYVRHNRGEVRIFPRRPTDIAGVFDEPEPVDRLLSSASGHARRLAAQLQALRNTKASRDTVGANAARDALNATAGRLVGLIRRHVARGLALVEARDGMWSTFSADVMTHLATFEAALALDATGALAPEPAKRRRIPSGLTPEAKALALIRKAGSEGALRTDLYRGIRPKLGAAELGLILDALTADGLIEPQNLRVRGTRFAMRFFANREQEA